MTSSELAKLSPRYRTPETEVFERGWEADLKSNQPRGRSG
jgi:hypothetical protein